MSRRHVPVWTLLGVILVAALLIGSGAFSSAPPTAAQRAAAIESVIRCPSCEDLSVAVSSAPTAVTVRATVSRLVDQGQSDRQIKDYLVARYGSAIVLDPPASGWSALVWILPIVVAIAGIAVLVVVLVRRRKGDRDLDADIRGESVDPAVVEERRRFLTQSLADADALCVRLDECGIRTFIPDQYAATVNPLFSNALGGIRVQVPEAEAADAKEFLDAPTAPAE